MDVNRRGQGGGTSQPEYGLKDANTIASLQNYVIIRRLILPWISQVTAVSSPGIHCARGNLGLLILPFQTFVRASPPTFEAWLTPFETDLHVFFVFRTCTQRLHLLK